MGLLTQLFERRQHPGADLDWAGMFGAGAMSHAGAQVDEKTALNSSAVWACVRVLAESVASLPLHLYRRQIDGGKVRAMEHALWPLLTLRPNPEMTAFELRETLMGHLGTWGNAYAEIEWSNGGQVVGLISRSPRCPMNWGP